MKKIAVFGGVFDPVHKGHIRAAEIVDEHLKPDVLLFMPSGRPPHKRKRINTGRHRLNMLTLAVSEKFGSRGTVCDYEINNEGYSYTAETLAHLKAVYGKDSELFFVIGADNITQIKNWYRPDIITNLSTIAVVARPGFSGETADKEFRDCVICRGDSIDISSTEVRELASRGEDFSQLVQKCVYDYIKENNLYPEKVTGIDKIREFVSGFLKPSRMEHTLGVEKTAVYLAKKHGCDKTRAQIAALIHDVAKNLSLQEMLNYCEKYDIIVDDMQKEQKSLLHALVSEGIAFFELGISEPEILNAVRYHTTGCGDMDSLAKIIYLADAIEPNRDYEGVEEIRAAADEDLDRACLMSLDNTVRLLLSRGMKVHPDTIEARNQLITILERSD